MHTARNLLAFVSNGAPRHVLGSRFRGEGLRRVRPYTHNFETHAKERWLGRTVIDVFSESRTRDVGASRHSTPYFTFFIAA